MHWYVASPVSPPELANFWAHLLGSLQAAASFHPFEPDNPVGKESASSAGDPSSISRLERSPREEIGYPLQYFWASLVARLVNNLPSLPEIWVQSLGWEDSLDKGKSTTPVFWLGEFHGLYSPWGHKESDTTELLSINRWKIHRISFVIEF